MSYFKSFALATLLIACGCQNEHEVLIAHLLGFFQTVRPNQKGKQHGFHMQLREEMLRLQKIIACHLIRKYLISEHLSAILKTSHYMFLNNI